MSPVRPRVIAGFARSGTTWVQDVLAESNRLRTVFEPLNPAASALGRVYAHRYKDARDVDHELYRFFRRYLVDDFHSIWADYRVRLDRLCPAVEDFASWSSFNRKRRLVSRAVSNYFAFRAQRSRRERITKLVRANMMLAWLQQNFDARIVLMLRHPGAVVSSQMRAPHIWDPYRCLEVYRQDAALLEVLEDPVKRLVFSSLGDIEAYALCWCIENRIAVQQARERGIVIVHYEHLCRREAEWKRILGALSLEALPTEQLRARPSQQSWRNSTGGPAAGAGQGEWTQRLRPHDIGRLQRVLEECNIDFYSMQETMPRSASTTISTTTQTAPGAIAGTAR